MKRTLKLTVESMATLKVVLTSTLLLNCNGGLASKCPIKGKKIYNFIQNYEGHFSNIFNDFFMQHIHKSFSPEQRNDCIQRIGNILNGSERHFEDEKCPVLTKNEIKQTLVAKMQGKGNPVHVTNLFASKLIAENKETRRNCIDLIDEIWQNIKNTVEMTIAPKTSTYAGFEVVYDFDDDYEYSEEFYGPIIDFSIINTSPQPKTDISVLTTKFQNKDDTTIG